jgi:hypothetical protein
MTSDCAARKGRPVTFRSGRLPRNGLVAAIHIHSEAAPDAATHAIEDVEDHVAHQFPKV